jgi:putative SbcD/Mre11-related phosphoesterase
MRVLSDWVLTPSRAAVHLQTQTAVAADLHLGYAEARQSTGDAVPAMPVAAVLAPLKTAFAAYGVRRLVVAGDLFEAGPSAGLVNDFLSWLRGEGVELAAVVPGNHDRGIEKGFGLPVAASGFDLAGWRVVHGDGPRPAGRVVQGHAHPWLRWGNGLAAACYLVARDHLVLPAFSPDAAGVNVFHDGRWSGHRCYAIAGDAILDFGRLDELSGRRSARAIIEQGQGARGR